MTIPARTAHSGSAPSSGKHRLILILILEFSIRFGSVSVVGFSANHDISLYLSSLWLLFLVIVPMVYGFDYHYGFDAAAALGLLGYI
ncbi:hypothetical protein F4825DRAFT_438767 [Nemania diffusa]|nr:hypothetical protein F4825DRAFT_438767 [Nemania diffusa]